MLAVVTSVIATVAAVIAAAGTSIALQRMAVSSTKLCVLVHSIQFLRCGRPTLSFGNAGVSEIDCSAFGIF